MMRLSHLAGLFWAACLLVGCLAAIDPSSRTQTLVGREPLTIGVQSLQPHDYLLVEVTPADKITEAFHATVALQSQSEVELSSVTSNDELVFPATLSYHVSTADGQRQALRLKRQDSLFSKDYEELTYRDGQWSRTPRAQIEAGRLNCFYRTEEPHPHPHPQRNRSSIDMAAFALCSGQLEGLLNLNGELMFLNAHPNPSSPSLSSFAASSSSSSGSSGSEVYVVYSAANSNLAKHNAKCGNDDSEGAHAHAWHAPSSASASASSASSSSPSAFESGSSSASPQNVDQLYVELVFVHDYYRTRGKADQMFKSGGNIGNMVNALYAAGAFGASIHISLVAQLKFESIEPWAPIKFNSDNEAEPGDLLRRFLTWSQNPANMQLSVPSYDNRVLLTGLDLDSSVVGMAPVEGMCISDASGSIVQTLSFSDAQASVTVAHEMGHNFGMLHDGSEAAPLCPLSGYIMASASDFSNTNVRWSQCSENAFVDWYSDATNGLCLFNKPASEYSVGVCGDGVVNGDEQCDCYNEETCAQVDPCCDANTCRLKAGLGYECSNSQPCCNQCKFIPLNAKEVCRPARDDICDTAETCSGTSGECPADAYRRAGTGCQDIYLGGGVCFAGLCHSPQSACKNHNASLSACDASSIQCGQLRCQDATGVCRNIVQTADNGLTQQLFVDDGVRCASGKQCRVGRCVESQYLDINSMYPVDPDSESKTAALKYLFYALLAVAIALILFVIFMRYRRKMRSEAEAELAMAQELQRQEARDARIVAGAGQAGVTIVNGEIVQRNQFGEIQARPHSNSYGQYHHNHNPNQAAAPASYYDNDPHAIPLQPLVYVPFAQPLPPNANANANAHAPVYPSYGEAGAVAADPSVFMSPSLMEDEPGTIALPPGVNPTPTPSPPPPSNPHAAAVGPTIALPPASSPAARQNAMNRPAPSQAQPQSKPKSKPLPSGWEAHRTSQGVPYWFNARSGETSWVDPTL